MKTKPNYWIESLCNADTLPETIGYVGRSVVTLEEAIADYEKENAK